MQPPFTQHLFGTTAGFLGGVAFAPNGDVWADNCVGDSGSLHRFAQGATYQTNGTTLHTETVVPSNAGCGLTNHPDGYLYSNTDQGVARLDAGTGAPITTLGPPGNVLGITVDPQTNDVVYVGADCRFTATCTIIRLNPTTGASSTFAVLNASDAQFVDGLAFDPSGAYLFLSNRAPTYRLTVLNRSGAIVQHVAMGDEPDGISFHSTAPQFVATSDTDGNITRFDFPHNDFTQTPTQSTFASGGYRGDLSQVGPDTCIYLTQDGTTYDDGSTASQDSIVRVCPGFAPPPGIAPTPTPVSGLIPWHPHQSVRFAAGLGASVDLADGHVDVGAADMSIPGRGPQLALNRTWDSLLAQRGVTTTAGEGWQSSLTPQLGGVLTATVSYTDDSGAAWAFVYSGDPAATGPYTAYTSPLGLPWQLTASSDGYTLTNFLTGATRTFDPNGRLSATADSYGNSDAVVDDGTDQGGGALVDSGGGAIAYSYTNGLVGEEASPLWQSSGGTQGQHVTAAYNGTLLTARTLGAGTADAVTTTFGYSGTQLVTVTTGMGHQWLLGYDAQGRVAAITNTDTTPADVTQFLYTPGQSAVIEGVGQPHQRATIYALDGQGQALSVQDAAGDTTTYTYDAQHDVTSRADANNAPGHDTTTHYAYSYAGPTGSLGPDGNVGLLTQETSPPVGAYSPQSAPAAQTTTYQYDPHTFDLVEVDKPGGGKTRYSYDGHHGRTATLELINTTSSGCGGQQAQLARPSAAPRRAAILVARAMAAPAACGTSQHTFSQWRGQLTSIDAFGEITGTTDARGVTVAPTEDTATPVAVPNAVAAAYTRQYTYTDAAGNDYGDLTSASSAPITTTRGVNAPVTTGYADDQDGEPITTTTPNGAPVVTAYDHLGRPIRTTRPGVALSVLGPTVTISTGLGYDGDGNVITATDGAGDLTQAVYDALGRTIRTINPVGATAVYTYSGPVLTDVQNTMGHTTHYDYDGADRLIGTTDPTGVHTQYSPDAAGNTAAITTPLDYNNSQANTVEQRGYDALNRVISDTVGGIGETSPSASQTTTTSYDADGNVAQVQAPNGDVTYHTYDILDRPQWSEVDPGLLTAPPTGSVAPPASEAYGFDAVDNLTYQSDFNTRARQLGYDAANRLTGQTNQPSCGGCATPAITITLGYDAAGAVVRATRQEGTAAPATTTTRDNAADWALSQDDGLGATYSAYDLAGRRVGQSLAVGAGGLTAGQVNLYDKAGRVTRTWDGAQGTSPLTTMSAFAYNAADLPVTTTLHAGAAGQAQEQRSYDADNRTSGVQVTEAGGLNGAGVPQRTYAYGRTPQGWITAVTDTVAGAPDTQALGYDALDHLRAAYLTVNGGTTTPYHWTYDGNGNLTSRVDVVQPNPLVTYGYTDTAGAAPANRLPNELVTTTVQTPGAPVTTWYGYDNAGDTTAITRTGASTTLTYDAAGRVSGASVGDGRTLGVRYNARGLRASETWTGVGQATATETFQYRGDRVGQVVVTGANPFTETFLYRSDGSPLEMLYQRAGQPLVRYWYALDGQGDVVALLDAAGREVDTYAYDPWGVPYSTINEPSYERVPQPLRYRGYWYDGWYYPGWTAHAPDPSVDWLPWYWLTTRYYDPRLERFLQPDPSSRDGVRSYVYCHDDPMNYADPSGLDEGDGEAGAEGGGTGAREGGLLGSGYRAVEPATGKYQQLPLFDEGDTTSSATDGLQPDYATRRFTLSLSSGWQKRLRALVSEGDRVIYKLDDAGTVLKVGKTSGGVGARSIVGRFEPYAKAGGRYNLDLNIEAWTVEPPSGVTMRSVEDAFREGVTGAGNDLPWDNSPLPNLGIGRLGRPGPGMPFVYDKVQVGLGNDWSNNPESAYYGMYLNNSGVPWQQVPNYYPQPFEPSE